MLAAFHYVVLGISLLISHRSQATLTMLKREMEHQGFNHNDTRRQSVATENAWDKHPHRGRSWSVYSRPDFPVEPYRTSAIIEDQLAAMEQRITASAERITELEAGSSRPNGDHDAVRRRSDPRKSSGAKLVRKSKRSSEECQPAWKMESVTKRVKESDVSASSEYELDHTWYQVSDDPGYTDNDELNGKIHEETSLSSSVEVPSAPIPQSNDILTKFEQRITRANRRTQATRSSSTIEQLIDGQIDRASNTNIPSKTDAVVADLNFSREFYHENAQHENDCSSSVTSLPSDGIPTTLNYVCRETTRDDPTSDTKSEIDQTEVTDVQSVTTVPMEPPLITQNDETKNTYVDYVRESIVSLWKQKETTQVGQVQNDLLNRRESVIQTNNKRSTDNTTSDNNTPHEVESHKTELIDIEGDNETMTIANENRSEDRQRHVQVQLNDNYDNQKTYTTNRVSKQTSSETGESLVPVTVNSSSIQSNVTHINPVAENENEAQIQNHIDHHQSPTTEHTPKNSETVAQSPQTSTSVVVEHNDHVSPINTRLPGAIIEQRHYSPNPPPPRPLDDDDQIRRTVHMANASRPSAIIVHRGEQDDAVEYRPTITGWAAPPPSQVVTPSTPDPPLAERDEWFDPSSNSDSDEFDPTQQRMSTLARSSETEQFDLNQQKMLCRTIDDNDQNRRTVHMANTVTVDAGEQNDALEYRPTATGWTSPPQVVTTSDQPLTEANDSSDEFDPTQQRASALVRRNSARLSGSDEFAPTERRLSTRRRTLKTSNLELCEDEADIDVQPRRESHSRMSVVELMAHTYRTNSTSSALTFTPSSTFVRGTKSQARSHTKTILNNVKFLQEQLVREKEHLIQIRDHQEKMKEKHRKKLEKTTGKLNYVRTSIRERVEELRSLFDAK